MSRILTQKRNWNIFIFLKNAAAQLTWVKRRKPSFRLFNHQIMSTKHAALSNRSNADGLTLLYNYIPQIQRLLQSLRETDLTGGDDSEIVVCRSAECCQSSADIIKARYARRHGKEINEASGIMACRHLPYKPFGELSCRVCPLQN